ncbi:hypothetical protein DYD21_16145 [Rhodohalobacter sp. SW132]|uniref:hypothetical protein n=2 Tax=Rhodohalobacter sp. SW132 TaxID=2293433 RepID=UPI000E27F435|nr:hypothetical protein [Rhodohalobacter sp. SW132]REL25043.1 hypothetical protein DYD21_16145 [Rhodohalobacter sp. SW132]
MNRSKTSNRADNFRIKDHIQMRYIRLKTSFFALVLITGFGLLSCDILDVDNPNSLIEEDLNNPAAAPAIANGAEATLSRGLGNLLAPYSTVTDELTWIGTRDAWLALNQGETYDPLNEFVDGAYASINEARWTADNAILRIEAFRDAGSLQNITPLVRSYLYGAIVYLTIADSFDNFVISDRQDAGHPIGRENLLVLIDTAIEYTESGLELASTGSDWETRLLAVRARALYSRALWNNLKPQLNTQNPLVESADAVSAAEEALAAIGSANDWRYQIEVTSETPSNNLAFQVNERLELRIDDTYVQPTSDNTRVESVTLEDPIDQIPAPFLVREIEEFTGASEYADYTIVSARELHLIIAEDAGARQDEVAFSEAINNLRSLDGLTGYSGQITERELLEHSRQVNLFLQGRRLADLYRFEKTSPRWSSSRMNPGIFFPITNSEITSNPNVNFGD